MSSPCGLVDHRGTGLLMVRGQGQLEGGPNPTEKHQSQIPALQLLVALGYTPLSPG